MSLKANLLLKLILSLFLISCAYGLRGVTGPIFMPYQQQVTSKFVQAAPYYPQQYTPDNKPYTPVYQPYIPPRDSNQGEDDENGENENGQYGNDNPKRNQCKYGQVNFMVDDKLTGFFINNLSASANLLSKVTSSNTGSNKYSVWTNVYKYTASKIIAGDKVAISAQNMAGSSGNPDGIIATITYCGKGNKKCKYSTKASDDWICGPTLSTLYIAVAAGNPYSTRDPSIASTATSIWWRTAGVGSDTSICYITLPSTC